MKKLVSLALKYVKLYILENEVEYSQNALYYIWNSFLFRCFREWILND